MKIDFSIEVAPSEIFETLDKLLEGPARSPRAGAEEGLSPEENEAMEDFINELIEKLGLHQPPSRQQVEIECSMGEKLQQEAAKKNEPIISSFYGGVEAALSWVLGREDHPPSSRYEVK